VKSAPETRPDARGLKVGLLCSLFNPGIVAGLYEGARAALVDMGAEEGDLARIDVPGAFELPLAARALALSGRFDALVALGAVVRGETDHYEHISRAATSGLQRVALETGVPIGFGVLTLRSASQARSRIRAGKGNKGGEAARAAVLMAGLLRAFRPGA
jgi:6,7-dimethyl-8-ribityllumazine synthase